MQIMAIDPGSIESGWVIFNTGPRRTAGRFDVLDRNFHIVGCGKDENEVLLLRATLPTNPFLKRFNGVRKQDMLVMEEMVAYGKCGREVTDTAFWAGRICEASCSEFSLLTRSKVRGHFKVRTDAGIIEKLIERFCNDIYCEFITGKLTTKKMINAARKEYFNGFKADIWQAFALGVAWCDINIH